MFPLRVVVPVRYIISQCFFYSTDMVVKPKGVQCSSCFPITAATYVMPEYPPVPVLAFTALSVMTQIHSTLSKTEHIVMSWVITLFDSRLNMVVRYNNLSLIFYCIYAFSI